MKPKTKATTERSEQTDGNEFARFDTLVRQVMSVPKKEIDRRQVEWEAEKAKKKAARQR